MHVSKCSGMDHTVLSANTPCACLVHIGKGKGFPYLLPSVGPGADPGVQVVSPQLVTISHPPGGRLPLLSARPAVTLPATEYWTAYHFKPNRIRYDMIL